jgi:hypothetical protein
MASFIAKLRNGSSRRRRKFTSLAIKHINRTHLLCHRKSIDGGCRCLYLCAHRIFIMCLFQYIFVIVYCCRLAPTHKIVIAAKRRTHIQEEAAAAAAARVRNKSKNNYASLLSDTAELLYTFIPNLCVVFHVLMIYT